MKILVFVCFVFFAFATSEISEWKCIESVHQKVKLNSGDAVICDKLIKNFTTEFTNDILYRLKAEDDQACILKTFDHYNISSLYLRGLIKHLYNHSPNNDDYENDVDESQTALLTAVKVLCTADSKYGEAFDAYFNSAQKQAASSSSHSDLCIRKYFFDKKIIDAAQYNINPLLINATNCGEVIVELEQSFDIPDDPNEKMNTFFGLPAAKAHECTKRKFAEEKILQNLYSFQIIENFELTQQQIKQLRSKFIEWTTSGVRFLMSCVNEI